MQLQEVKATTLNISGLVIEIDRTAGSIKRVTMKERSGEVKLIVNCASYSVEVLEPAPPKMKTVYRLTVKLFGGDHVVGEFETECEAENKAEAEGFSTDKYIVTEVEVLDV